MADKRLRLSRTGTDVLISNLRGEVGEAVTTWLLLRHLTALAATQKSTDPAVDIRNKELAFVSLLKGKLRDARSLIAMNGLRGTR